MTLSLATAAGRWIAFVSLLVAATAAPLGAETVGFNEHIRPILVKHCVACHGGPKQAAGVTFLQREGALTAGDSGQAPIVAGDADASLVMERVTADEDYRMPPAEHGPRLTDREVESLRAWIDQGANWQEHWSLVAPTANEPPDVSNNRWPRGEVDRFVLAGIEARGMSPSPPASRAAWLRRVTFDLTGLPPSREELDEFLLDNSADAFERVVDRLLASPRYGERWASMWLDLARYADTMGYERDYHRDIWPYRDWLIRALNADLPYDEFIIKQMAGDLLPEATLEDQLATAFHRNTQTNLEGGTDDEEFRIAAVLDRVNTTWQVWMGATFGCCQCHDHPYDAFSAEDYYRFAAFFNTSRDGDLSEELPRLSTPVDPANYSRADEIDRRLASIEQETFAGSEEIAADEGQWRWLTLDKLHSTGSTKLQFVDGDLIASGTITNGSKYTFEAATPGDVTEVTALRIDAMPRDPEEGRKNPDLGFILSRLQLEVLNADGEPQDIELKHVFADEPHPMIDPRETLRDNGWGWAAYSRIFGQRRLVVVPAEPLSLPEGARLRFRLRHDRSLDGQGALVIRRGRFAVSSDPRWTTFVGSEPQQQREQELAELRRQRRALESINVPVMQERADKHRRDTYFFVRGAWLDKGEQVQPGTPASMPPLVHESEGPADRLAMARWIASPENPLTGRTMVNRVWSRLFGVGLVETEEDFGGAGEEPSHPELLDHLALKFSGEHQWSVKRLLRELVLSATYRQDAAADESRLHDDPRNRFLARGPRQRLSAEMVRDQALAVSGRLSPRMHGKPVMPYQPDHIWQATYNTSDRWKTSEGEDRFRRAVYTYWKRTAPYPSLMTFDMASREVCTVRRIATNTPLQALVTLNDPAFLELAQAYAGRIASEGGETVEDQIGWAYRTATGRRPDAAIVAALLSLHEEAAAEFSDDEPTNRKLADTAERFALVVVANAVLNLDAALTR